MKKQVLFLFAFLMALNSFAQILCSPSFTWSQTSSQNPFQISVINTSTVTGAPVYAYKTFSMNWGNGTSSINATGATTHSYTSAGTYALVLTMNVYDSLNNTLLCTSTYNATVTVVASACNTTITSTNNGNGSYTFASSNQATGMTYAWSFGDGTSAGNVATTNHTYTTPGNYTVTLTTTLNGVTCTTTTTVNYQSTSFNCAALVASFTKTQNNLSVTFNNTSSVVNNVNPIISRVSDWTFGDGGTANNTYSSVSHTYATAGTYTVRLINRYVDSANANTVYCRDTAYQTVTVTGTTANYIAGNIYWDSTLNINSSSFKVWLITFDTSTNIINAVDSVTATGAYGQVAYQFNNKASGSYRVKAAVVAGAAGYTQMAPTYHATSTYWANATMVNHTGGASANRNIYMQAGSSANGPGFVAGNVTLGAGKGTATGVPNLLILLRNASNQLVKSTFTNANGDYSFSNVPVGTYTIYPENMPQVTTPSAAFTISTTNANVTGMDFTKNSKKIVPNSLAVASLSNAVFCSIAPNPANDVLTIQLQNANAPAQVRIVDVLGKTMLTTSLQTTTSIINTSALAPGMYYMHITQGTAQQVERLMIQK
jgi:PKD repeat protein